MIDVNAWIGAYPFRDVPHPEPAVLARVLEREGFSGAWVGHLPSAFWRDAHAGNAVLRQAVQPFAGVLHATPIARPDWPGWEAVVDDATRAGEAAIRAYPMQWGIAPDGPAMRSLAHRCASRGRVLLLSVRFEDGRQRHPMDAVSDLPAWGVRELVRQTEASIVVAGAGADAISEIAFGLTDSERERIWFDPTWLWGPPDDQFERLVGSLGRSRFACGTGWPLRLAQQSRALLSLSGWEWADFADGARIARAAAQRATG